MDGPSFGRDLGKAIKLMIAAGVLCGLAIGIAVTAFVVWLI